ncbi:bifunctional folylpolyglutamate synthase/dihydrofolate synthase, partial [Opitutaceae bacterium]|nr:bifunctional folylpolyglutamate synthase/dihydrofolate synthase [Opitutaceae bacterium]
PIVVVGALGLARAQPLIEAVAKFAQEIHIVVPQQARACGFADIRGLIPSGFQRPVHESTVEDLFTGDNLSTWSSVEDTVVVTGSIYLAGEVMGYLRPHQGEIEAHLQDF